MTNFKFVILVLIILFVTDNLFATECVAHRGDSSQYLENSLSSIKSAALIKAHGVEFDIRHTKDQKTILLHDKNLKRVAIETPDCPVKTPLAELNYSQIKNCKLNNDERIPTFETILELLGQYPIKVFIELKDHPTKDDINTIYKFYKNMGHKIYFISFSAKYLFWIQQELKKKDILQNTSFLHLQKLPKRKTSFDGLNLFYRLTSARRIRKLQDLDKLVGVWTINKSKNIQKFINKSVNFITTNYPEKCLTLVQN